EFEKRGIFSEWDMVPLLLAALWNDILEHRQNLKLPADLFSAAVIIGHHANEHVPRELIIPEFEFIAGLYPSEAALQHGCFPHIPMDLRVNILSQSRNVNVSQTMRLFQHYSLGSEVFTQTYDLPAEVETDSFLHTHDRSNINDAIHAKLRQPGICLAGLTARPSAPPREVDVSHFGYAPEAEIALELVGLADIPLIAFGKLEYLAAQSGLDAGALIKPSPVHALAATAAALTGNEWAGLQSAGDWFKTGKLDGIFTDLPREFELFVVEDTLGGIRSTQAAGEILRQHGFGVITHTLGITSGSAAKIAAFNKADIPYFENWESLIEQVGL
ncbi:MAG: hypothetical protein Q8L87_19890, partial [Anaerolineales bacterium]|nr:hypothetical protein [Anaerolineales bacterium]